MLPPLSKLTTGSKVKRAAPWMPAFAGIFGKGGVWLFWVFDTLPETPVKTGVHGGAFEGVHGSAGAFWIPAFAGIFGRVVLGDRVSG